MEKQTEEMVEVRGREPLPKTAVEIVYSAKYDEYILKTEALEGLSAEYGAVHIDHEHEFLYVTSRGLSYHEEDTRYSEEMDQTIHQDDALASFCGIVATEQYFEMNSDWYFITRGCADGHYVWYEDARYCEDIQESVHEDEVHYCEYNDEYYWDSDNVRSNHDSRDRSLLHEYHHGPDPLDLSEGAQFRVGFEIEKNEILGISGDDEVGEEIGNFDLIAKFETDSSCGVEAITHILPLSGVRSHRRRKVFNMIDQAADVINDECSNNCGGHITISVRMKNKRNISMDSLDLLEKIRGNLSVLYALYRFRLNNSYCQHNKKLKKVQYRSRGVITIKNSECIEIRLPNRVQNTRQLKLRYDLMYILVRRSLEGLAYSKLLKEVKPILMKMYNKDRAKVKYIMDISKMFRKYIISDKVDPEIQNFIYGETNEED